MGTRGFACFFCGELFFVACVAELTAVVVFGIVTGMVPELAGGVLDDSDGKGTAVTWILPIFADP